MLMRLLFAALAGGAIFWVWGAVSWMVLSWHHATFRRFDHEDEVVRTVLAACPQSGIYGLPSPSNASDGDPESRVARDQTAEGLMKTGPIVTAIVQRSGFGSVPLAMLRAFIIYSAMSAVLMFLLLQTSGDAYWNKVVFVAAVGLAAGLTCRAVDWNWHGYSTAYTLVNIADHVVGAFLVGLALARL